MAAMVVVVMATSPLTLIMVSVAIVVSVAPDTIVAAPTVMLTVVPVKVPTIVPVIIPAIVLITTTLVIVVAPGALTSGLLYPAICIGMVRSFPIAVAEWVCAAIAVQVVVSTPRSSVVSTLIGITSTGATLIILPSTFVSITKVVVIPLAFPLGAQLPAVERKVFMVAIHHIDLHLNHCRYFLRCPLTSGSPSCRVWVIAISIAFKTHFALQVIVDLNSKYIDGQV